MRTRMAVTSAIGILALVLTGCSAGPEEPADDSQQTEETSEAPADEAETETDNSDEQAGDATAPGTELSLGDTATVLYPDTDDGEQMLEITVTEVSEAPLSDFEAAGDDFLKQLEGYTPYYVSVEATKIEPFEVELDGKDPIDGMFAFDSDDNRAAPVNMIGNFEPCDNQYMEEANDKGEPLETCMIFAVPEGSELGSVAWAPNDTEFSYLDGDPVTWKP
ncbi:hypothetical protein [Microbacterium sp. MPKO10]|uniref:hypothetical protein n=1 Tax=Microbacterium sp. MPKO10 TaxID=2989818 RepID=UPI0022366E48|nr:hypothetical protein [Microbacterium sp. MPKO10]MCW4458040.1 hypothetical protein [Microbacterium sp. MPKO10]